MLGGWQISGVTSKQSGRPFTIFTGVDSSGDANTGSDRPNINPSGSFVWDEDHRTFTNNGYYVVPLGTNGLPLANSLGNGNAPRNSERYAPAWLTDLSLMKRVSFGGRQVSLPSRRIQRVQSGRLRGRAGDHHLGGAHVQQHEQSELRPERLELGPALASVRGQVLVLVRSLFRGLRCPLLCHACGRESVGHRTITLVARMLEDGAGVRHEGILCASTGTGPQVADRST